MPDTKDKIIPNFTSVLTKQLISLGRELIS